jgi:hypothetical protein
MWTEILDSISFGKSIEAHGEKWLVVKVLESGWYLVVRPNDECPAQAFVVKPDVVEEQK